MAEQLMHVHSKYAQSLGHSGIATGRILGVNPPSFVTNVTLYE